VLLGEAAQQVVLEEFLEGDEISFLCLSDGKHVAPLVPSQTTSASARATLG